MNQTQLDPELFERAVCGLRSHLDTSDIEWFQERIAADPERWWCEDMFHFRGGMWIRNLLRTEVGILDDQVPGGNWDDHYIEIIEEAVKRPYYDDW